ncbi:SDR family NAD(P)-dependent oxidoreductase [Magnetospirillum gryphiswaldense]|uniref:Dehydrogenases with different specificities (Related to short-chain alcohol dehydrogenases) n=1 Tax=Magnetospirillum gryphiswaldense TaxID=55518 RepID=A4U161_9PROT|nr:SDR family oxidoreductase [Magnetospirillum gryphiswaldense]AVM75601.1 3-oxoacyl-[acyl-carrier-protein] reductase FabG [Magnetospirillum gryphiswaldense MSR-1]AVM79504.1 3-oxoacyl-[acyl-carrier-protein] reductase FabG [Magnetospirillum gryphiswaldense]CAM76618.1 Dehydrogenases with different specificities (related to short-chain alcohol dehydrogenases) [Magnetospirillum gryphiswaldense MSR-1]
MTVLAGKLAVVTGATRGIGLAIAQRLAADGARMLVTGTQLGQELESGWAYRAVDFTDLAQIQAFAAELVGLEVDILVNNAGINKIAPFTRIEPDDFLRIQQVNVTAPFLLTQAVVAGMCARKWGRIVTISSIWGRVSKAERGSYSTSKFAVDGMTAALAAEVAEYGVLANCVAPGFIDTELTRQVLGEDGIASLVKQVPARRLGKPEEVANLVAWLAGPENSYVSGQNIAIDGGFTRV